MGTDQEREVKVDPTPNAASVTLGIDLKREISAHALKVKSGVQYTGLS